MKNKWHKKWKKIIFRREQDSNLWGNIPLDFESNALTTRPSRPWIETVKIPHFKSRVHTARNFSTWWKRVRSNERALFSQVQCPCPGCRRNLNSWTNECDERSLYFEAKSPWPLAWLSQQPAGGVGQIVWKESVWNFLYFGMILRS